MRLESIVLSGFLFFLAIRLPAQPTDLLWQKAVAAQDVAQSWKPTKMHSVFIGPNESGKTGTSVTDYVITYASDGTEKNEIVRATFDGKDVTAEAKARAKKNEGKAGGPFGKNAELKPSPFFKEEQQKVTAIRMPATVKISGKSCAVFDFTYKGAKSAMKGTAWLDETSGVPVRLSYSFDPNPSLIQKMTAVYEYQALENGVIVVSTTGFEGKGAFLVFAFEFTGTMTLSEYVKLN